MSQDYPTISLDEAWRRIAAAVRPLPPRLIPLAEALGCVLAQDVQATENMPPFAASAMDGYAVIAADATPSRRVIGEQTAGRQLPLRVEPGAAARIMTGAPLPEGADAVIKVEDSVEQDGWVRFTAAVPAGRDVRPAGQDVAAGEVVLERGAVLGPAEIGLLATVGRIAVLAHPRPRVAVMATGDELVAPDQQPGPGQIRDSNSYALLAAVQAAGCQAIHLGRIPDDEQALRAAMLSGLAQADALITSGGVSMGTRDLVKPLLEELGAVHFGQVASRPGKPFTFATVQGKPVFGLPGFPVSSLVTFENMVRPALRIMGGHAKLRRPRVLARLSHAIRHAPDRTEFQRAVVVQRDGAYWAATTGVQVSGRLKSMAGANALLELPAGVSDFAQGQEAVAILITLPEVD